jgi:hypothetical protein
LLLGGLVIVQGVATIVVIVEGKSLAVRRGLAVSDLVQTKGMSGIIKEKKNEVEFTWSPVILEKDHAQGKMALSLLAVMQSPSLL